MRIFRYSDGRGIISKLIHTVYVRGKSIHIGHNGKSHHRDIIVYVNNWLKVNIYTLRLAVNIYT